MDGEPQLSGLSAPVRVLRPLIVTALHHVPAHADLARLLATWDGVDRAEAAAPLVHQALYREIARGSLVDELGEQTAACWFNLARAEAMAVSSATLVP